MVIGKVIRIRINVLGLECIFEPCDRVAARSFVVLSPELEAEREVIVPEELCVDPCGKDITFIRRIV